MQYAPHELREKLLRGLDKDNNVVDMPAVLEAISILEKYPVTKEVLEQTRIGLHVNNIRKKTTDKDLARRAKQLVRRWQKFISSSSASNVSINGERIGQRKDGSETGAPSAIPANLLEGQTGSRPNSPASRPGTPSSFRPGTPSSLRSTQSPSLPSVGSRPATPGSSYQQSKVSPKLISSRPLTPASKPASPATAAIGRRVSPNVPTPLTSTPVSSSQAQSVRPSTPNTSTHETPLRSTGADKRKRAAVEDSAVPVKKALLNNNGVEQQHKVRLKPETAAVPNGLIHGAHQHDLVAEQTRADSLSNTHSSVVVSTKPAEDSSGCLRTPGASFSDRKQTNLTVQTSLALDSTEGGPLSSDSLGQRPRLERTASSSSSLSARTPKVRSTAQLIHDLYTRGDLRIKGSQTVSKIALNQIEKEPDVVRSVVPPEAKPRPRRKPGTSNMPPQTSEQTLSQTKTEMVEKFLEESVLPVTASLPPVSSEPDLSSLLLESSQPVDSPASITTTTLLLDSLVQEDNTCMSANGSVDTSVSQCPPADRTQPVTNSETVNSQIPNNTPRGQIDWSQVADPWSLLPTLDVDSIDWTEPDLPSPHFGDQVTDDDVEALHSQHLPGINGNYDYKHEWHDWSETFSLPTYNGDLLHILPYVNVDD